MSTHVSVRAFRDGDVGDGDLGLEFVLCDVLFWLVILGILQVLSVAALGSGQAVILVLGLGKGGRLGPAGDWEEWPYEG